MILIIIERMSFVLKYDEFMDVIVKKKLRTTYDKNKSVKGIV